MLPVRDMNLADIAVLEKRGVNLDRKKGVSIRFSVALTCGGFSLQLIKMELGGRRWTLSKRCKSSYVKKHLATSLHYRSDPGVSEFLHNSACARDGKTTFDVNWSFLDVEKTIIKTLNMFPSHLLLAKRGQQELYFSYQNCIGSRPFWDPSTGNLVCESLFRIRAAVDVLVPLSCVCNRAVITILSTYPV